MNAVKTKVNSQFIKELNELRILNLIKNEGPISRIAIAKRTNISKVAVSEIVGRLDEAGYILEIGKGSSTKKGGKRPTLIKLNPCNGYVVGIEIRRVRTVVALANLESKIVDREQIEYSAGAPMEEVLPRIFEKIEFLMRNNKIASGKLVSIGIGLPGFLDYKKGNLIFADTLKGWADRPLAETFKDRFKVPVIIENDVNAVTLGEHLIGAGQASDNMVCIWIGEGLGAGIIVNGELIRGDYGSAGEIGYFELGHHVSNREYFRHLYSNQKYFGDVLAEEHFLEALRMKLRWGMVNPPEKLEQMPLEEFLSEKFPGSFEVQELLDEYALLLSTLCADLVKTINPNLLILNGKIIEHSDYLFRKTRQNLKQQMVNIPFEPTKVVLGDLKEDACILGVVVMALQVRFEPFTNKSINHIGRNR